MRFHSAFGLDVSDLDIVLVEDNKNALKVHEALLKAFRVRRVRCFDDAQKAYDAIKRVRSNLLITECLKPPFDGLRLARLIRHVDNEPGCFIPIIMLDAVFPEEAVSKARRCGIGSFLRKPLTPSSLYEGLTEVLTDRRRIYRMGDQYVVEERETTAVKVPKPGEKKSVAAD